MARHPEGRARVQAAWGFPHERLGYLLEIRDRLTGPLTSFQIGQAKEDELETLETIDRVCFPSQPYGPAVMRQMFEICGSFFLRAVRQEIVGFSLGAPEVDDPETGWILGLAVLPQARNYGVGRTLTVTLLERMRSSGLKRCRLSVEPDNEPALALYQSLGALEIGLRESYFGSDARLLMELEI